MAKKRSDEPSLRGKSRFTPIERQEKIDELASEISSGKVTSISVLTHKKAVEWKVTHRTLRVLIKKAEERLKDEVLYQRANDSHLCLSRIDYLIANCWAQIDRETGSESVQTVYDLRRNNKNGKPGKPITATTIVTKGLTKEMTSLYGTLEKLEKQRNTMLGVFRPDRQDEHEEEPDIIEVEHEEGPPPELPAGLEPIGNTDANSSEHAEGGENGSQGKGSL